MIISRVITASSKAISPSFSESKRNARFNISFFFENSVGFMFPGKLWKILVGQVKREREREVKSAHLEYQIAYSFSTWFSPRGSLAISTRPKREFLFFRKKSNQKNRILKKSKIRVRVEGEINCRDWKIFNSYVPWGGKTLTQATPSAPDREELEKETIPDIKKATKWQRWDFIFLMKVIKMS